jgi:hypothetical protein
MELMAHELLHLYWHGVEVTLPQSLGGTRLVVCAMLLQWVCDYRGYPKCFRHTQSPACVGACYVCDQQGVSIPPRPTGSADRSSKVVYPGCWRDCSHAPTAARCKKLNTIPDQSSGPHSLKCHADVVAAAQSADAALARGISHKKARHPASQTGAYLTAGACAIAPCPCNCPPYPLPLALAIAHLTPCPLPLALSKLATLAIAGACAGIHGSHAFMLLPYWDEQMMRRPDPAHTLGNEGRAIIDTFTGVWPWGGDRIQNAH